MQREEVPAKVTSPCQLAADENPTCVSVVRRQSTISLVSGACCFAVFVFLVPLSQGHQWWPLLLFAGSLIGLTAAIWVPITNSARGRALFVCNAALGGSVLVTMVGEFGYGLQGFISWTPQGALSSTLGLLSVVWPAHSAMTSWNLTSRRSAASRPVTKSGRGGWGSYGAGMVIAVAAGCLAVASVSLSNGQSLTGCGPLSPRLQTAQTTATYSVLLTMVLVGYLLFAAIPVGPRTPGIRRWNRGGVVVAVVGLVAVLPLAGYAMYAVFAASFCLTF